MKLNKFTLSRAFLALSVVALLTPTKALAGTFQVATCGSATGGIELHDEGSPYTIDGTGYVAKFSSNGSTAGLVINFPPPEHPQNVGFANLTYYIRGNESSLENSTVTVCFSDNTTYTNTLEALDKNRQLYDGFIAENINVRNTLGQRGGPGTHTISRLIFKGTNFASVTIGNVQIDNYPYNQPHIPHMFDFDIANCSILTCPSP